MAKVKSKFFQSIQNPLAGRGHGEASASGLSASFYTSTQGVIMRTKPKSPPHTSQPQKDQQRVWIDGDCMYKGMTWGQSALWQNYYVDERIKGHTKYGEATEAMLAAGNMQPHDMGKQSFFMHHALRLDLLAYLQDFLESNWLISDVQDKGDFWEITLGLTNPDELTEANIFLERLPVRGY